MTHTTGVRRPETDTLGNDPLHLPRRCWRQVGVLVARCWPYCLPLLVVPWLLACGVEMQPSESQGVATSTVRPVQALITSAAPATPAVDLALSNKDLKVAPLPLRAGFPFTVTAVIHNNSGIPAEAVPLMVHISAEQEEIGYTSFVEVLTVTLPPTRPLSVQVPVRWNLAGGKHRLWVQVNRLPAAWQAQTPASPEADVSDNVALLDLMVEPFDAYVSALCPGSVDVEIDPADILIRPDRQQVVVSVHNVGNHAVYNLPVVVLGDQLAGVAYTPAIPPCGGTAAVTVDVDRPLMPGELVTVQVNPKEWVGSMDEDDLSNNLATVSTSLAADQALSPRSKLQDYDFSIGSQDFEAPEQWLIIVTVHNLGTRDAAMIPIRVENAAGRKITDAIPLVQGNGLGVAAIRVGYLWTRGGTLTFTVNPEKAKGALPESNRGNNVATFVLP